MRAHSRRIEAFDGAPRPVRASEAARARWLAFGPGGVDDALDSGGGRRVRHGERLSPRSGVSPCDHEVAGALADRGPTRSFNGHRGDGAWRRRARRGRTRHQAPGPSRRGGGSGGVAGMVRRTGSDALSMSLRSTAPVGSSAASIRRRNRPNTAFRSQGCFDMRNPLQHNPGLADPGGPGAPTGCGSARPARGPARRSVPPREGVHVAPAQPGGRGERTSRGGHRSRLEAARESTTPRLESGERVPLVRSRAGIVAPAAALGRLGSPATGEAPGQLLGRLPVPKCVPLQARPRGSAQTAGGAAALDGRELGLLSDTAPPWRRVPRARGPRRGL